jgi:hypothetical protein
VGPLLTTLCCGKRLSQGGRIEWNAIGRHSPLEPPSFGERPRIHHVIAELVVQSGDDLLGRSIVAGNGERTPPLRWRWLGAVNQILLQDCVERLDHTGTDVVVSS